MKPDKYVIFSLLFALAWWLVGGSNWFLLGIIAFGLVFFFVDQQETNKDE